MAVAAPRAGGAGPVPARQPVQAQLLLVPAEPVLLRAQVRPVLAHPVLAAPVELPPQPPVVLSRNGREYTFNSGNVRAGTEIKVTTERPSVTLTLTEMDAGSWVIFELPGFTTAASGTEQSSLDALRKASDTSYFKGKDALWVKVVSNGNGAAAPVAAGLVREPACRSAGKLKPAVEPRKPPARPGAFFS